MCNVRNNRSLKRRISVMPTDCGHHHEQLVPQANPHIVRDLAGFIHLAPRHEHTAGSDNGTHHGQ